MTDRRPLPNSLEAERALIGIAILDNKKIPDLIPLVGPEDFYSDKSKAMWEGIITLACANKEVSIVSLNEFLEDKITLTEIAKVIDGVPRSADAAHYAKVVRDKSRDRKIIQAAHRLTEAAYVGDTDEAATLITKLAEGKLQGKRDHALSDDIRKWVETSSGPFSITDCYNSLHGATLHDKPNIRVVLSRLKNEGLIEPTGKRDGVYRRVENNLEPMDYLNAPTEGLEFDWPLSLHEICTIFPKDIVCAAGTWNAGKTAFAVDFIRRNQDKWKINYFNCEMSDSRLKDRLLQVDDMPLDGWKFSPYYRADNFADVIKPNDVNIIDYLEIVEEHWLVAKQLKEIHQKLEQGIAIVLVQKPQNRDTGVGGDKGLAKPNLYVAIDHGRAKLVKVKSWKGENNPNKHIIDFKLVHGWKFVTQNEWHSEEAGEAADGALGKTGFKLRR
jgi:hypothetical protein